MKPVYLDTARLLARIAPVVLSDDTFALKGGTAINLFVRNMPRLSVDLDVVLVDRTLAYDDAIVRIASALRDAASRLAKLGIPSTLRNEGDLKLTARSGRIDVKVEVTPVMRGVLHPVRRLPLTAAAEEALLAEIEVPVVSFEDLYGGKLAAAMDRQHPRDLFDVMLLFDNEGITPEVRRAFVVYLACHTRPLHEVLFPTLKDVARDFASGFEGMTTEPVALDQLLDARRRMIDLLHRELDADERRFLLSIARNRPDWSALGIDGLDTLPALQWKLANLARLERNDPPKFAAQVEALAARLAPLDGSSQGLLDY